MFFVLFYKSYTLEKNNLKQKKKVIVYFLNVKEKNQNSGRIIKNSSEPLSFKAPFTKKKPVNKEL